MQESEIEFARDYFSASQRDFENAIRDLPPERWRARLTPESWSVAECAEHVVIVETLVRGRFESLGGVAAEPYSAEKSKEKDDAALKVAERLTKISAPAFALPAGKYADPNAALADYRNAHQAVATQAFADPELLRGRFQPHPALGKLDGYQWLLALSAHTRRHTAQIAEILALAG